MLPETLNIGFVSLGCPKNLVDTEIMLGHLRNSGFAHTSDVSQSDVIVINTCGFIESARKESIDTILEMAQQKKTGRCRRLVVTGCLVQRYHEELQKEIPEIDAFVGLDDLEKIGEAVRAELVSLNSDPSSTISGMAQALYDHRSSRVLATSSHSAYLKISEGCDHPCAFCAIPGIRGKMRSRTVDSLVAETRNLSAQGVKEVILIAQDTTDYGQDLQDGTNLPRLLRNLEEVDGVEWIRIHYAYPNRITRNLLETIATSSKVCHYLDIPLQHADQELLRSMKRGGSREVFREMVARIRDYLPDCALRTTFIVGFPGETETAFEELAEFVEETRFDHVGVFTYSHEEGTSAYEFHDNVRPEIKEKRRDLLLRLQKKISLEKNRAKIGKTLEVRIDGLEPDTKMLLVGRTEFQSPDVDGRILITDGEGLPGELVPVMIFEAHPYDLVGAIHQPGLKRRDEV